MPIVEGAGLAVAYPRRAISRAMELAMKQAILDGMAAVDRDGNPKPDTPDEMRRRMEAARQHVKAMLSPDAVKAANPAPDPKAEAPIDTGAQAADVAG